MDMVQIQKRISMIEKYTKEIRDAKEMLKEELESDPLFIEIEQEASEINTRKKRLKDDILNKGSNKKLIDEIRANTEEIALLKEILSAELVQVFKEQDTDEIADEDGETRKFKVSVKLMPKRGVVTGRDDFGKYTGSPEGVSE